MADKMDKALTQEPRTKLDIPGEEEIAEAQEVAVEAQQTAKGPVEVNEEEDGSVTVDFDPNAVSPEGGDEHYANLAEFLEDHILDELGSDLLKILLSLRNAHRHLLVILHLDRSQLLLIYLLLHLLLPDL